MTRSTFQALDPSDRRQALRRASLAIASIAVADLVVSGGGAFRAAVWGGWLVLFLGASVVVVRGPPWVTALVGLVTSAGVLLALFLLAAASGGSHSLYFLIATMVPVLSVLLAPDDTVDAALQGAVVLAAGLVLQAREGQDLPRQALYATIVVTVTAIAIQASVGHRRRLERLLEEEARRAHHQVELERARQRADRWASIGKLAEGVAHDVNSPLGSLRSNLAYLREELAAGRGQGRELDEAIEDSLQALERIRETVASLRAISVPEPGPEAASVEPGQAAWKPT
jgi:signal transduction histidine kinase